MKRKRLRINHDLTALLDSSGGILEHVTMPENYANKDNISPNFLDKIPDSSALSLGRPEGFHLSDVEKHLLEVIRDAFDAGILNDLSQMQRACFTDVVISGDTYDIVAARYRISRGAVQTHINRAATRIRKAIGSLNE